MKSKSLALSLGVAVLLCVSTAFAQSYNFTAVNYPNDTFTQLLGINDSNIIAGYHGASINKGFTYNFATGVFTDENYPDSVQTQVTGINNNPPKTVGFYISKQGKTFGFTDYQGSFKSVEYPGKVFNQLLSQNDYGQAAGYYSASPNGVPDTAYIYDEKGGVFEAFAIPGSSNAQATGINNAQNVCGFFIDKAGTSFGWLQVQGTFTVLTYPGSAGTAALGLNDKGQVVGSWSDSSGGTHGFVYNVANATFTNVDDPDGVGTTIVNGINNNGTLVGFWGTAPLNYGFVATPQ